MFKLFLLASLERSSAATAAQPQSAQAAKQHGHRRRFRHARIARTGELGIVEREVVAATAGDHNLGNRANGVDLQKLIVKATRKLSPLNRRVV
nr:hypothetical protein [Accumulibacter sp.]